MRTIAVVLIMIGLVLALDEAWMFGVPFGHFLPDLSWLGELTINGEHIHHWLLGICLVILGLLLSGTGHREDCNE